MKKILKLIPIIMIGMFLTTTALLADTRILKFGNNLEFASVTVGKSATQELTLYNKGDSPLTIKKIRFHKNIAQAYSGNYSGTIPVGGEQNVTITFAPKLGMEYTGLVYVESDRTNTNNDRSKLLSGTGIDVNGSVPTRILACSPKILDFGDVNIGEKKTKELRIFNLGTAPLTVHLLRFHKRLGGIFYSDFNASVIIPVGESYRILITFVPSTIGAVSGLFYIESDRTNVNDNSWLLLGRARLGENPKELTLFEQLVPATCKGRVVKKGLDTNANGVLDSEEVTFREEQYDKGNPISREELREKILEGYNVTAVNTCKITDMSYLFDYQDSFNQNISGWNTSNVTNMSHMFRLAKSFNQPIESWDTSSVKDMSYMFWRAESFNQSLDKWNTSNVKDMSYMFYLAKKFNQSIGQWDMSLVTNLSKMFSWAIAFNQPLGEWDVSNVKNMSFLFDTARQFNQTVEEWDTSNVKNMESLFSNAVSFNQPIGNWDTSNVKSMRFMFYDAVSFNQPIGNWNLSNVIDIRAMFLNAVSFNQPIGDWDISNVIYMSSIFSHTKFFNQPIEEWNTSNVTDMGYVFSSAKSFNQPIENWDTSNVTNMGSMFSGASSFNYPIGSWDTSNVTNMNWMFAWNKSFNQPIGNWNTSNVRMMYGMFESVKSFNQNIKNWNVSNVQDYRMFVTKTSALQDKFNPFK